MRRVFLTDARLKVADQGAAVGDDKHMSPRENFEQIGIDRRHQANAEGKFLGEFTFQSLGMFFPVLEAAARQFPLVTVVPDEHNQSVEEQHPFDRSGRLHCN